MEFEYDPAKSAANKDKHCLYFFEAQALWNDPNRQLGDAIERGERREMLFAMFDEKIWSAVFVKPGTRIRLISVRRARDNEVKLYEQPKP